MFDWKDVLNISFLCFLVWVLAWCSIVTFCPGFSLRCSVHGRPCQRPVLVNKEHTGNRYKEVPETLTIKMKFGLSFLHVWYTHMHKWLQRLEIFKIFVLVLIIVSCLIHSAVRVALYRTLELWVRVGRASSSVLQGSSSHSELLFAHLIGDITPGAEAVKVSQIFAVASRFRGCTSRKHNHLEYKGVKIK